MQVENAIKYMQAELAARLEPTLYYHGIHHSEDVAQAASDLAELENITDPSELDLLRTAAWYHDSGFMNTYQGHETEGCRIAREVLSGFGYSESDLDIICGMIMATKIPQNPQTKLECILCDADLDYLGRSDFEPIADSLFEEMKVRELISDPAAWNEIQVRFLESHSYWTESARARRNATKEKQLTVLKNRL